MTTPLDGRSPPKGRPGPKPRGRTVVPLTITVTHAQRADLEARADTEQVSISTIVRRFVAAGLAASGLFVLTALIEVAIAYDSGACILRAGEASSSTRTKGIRGDAAMSLSRGHRHERGEKSAETLR